MRLKWQRTGRLIFVALMLVLSAQPGMAQETQTVEADSSSATPQFGGPNSVPGQLADDAKVRGSLAGDLKLRGYFAWKDRVSDKYGISFTLDYTAGLLAATNTLNADDTFSSGAVRFFGTWALVGRESGNTGTFVWKVENRHKYTDIPVSGTASEVGYVGLLLPILSDIKWRLTNLYWKQNLNEGRLEIIAGFIDVTDWVDLYALAAPWNGFFNFALATGSATIPVPDDGGIGAYVNAMITDHLYVIGGLADANANSTDPFNSFDTFFKDNEYFTSIELGWVTSPARFYFDNTHLTFWHVDARESAGTSSGWGANFSYAHAVGVKWTPYFRGGYAKDGGSLLQKSLSAGIGYHLSDEISLFGLGFNWNEPNEDTFGPGLDDQFSTELFWRLQVAQKIQVTPAVEWIINPALNPEADESFVVGLRARVYF